MPTWQTHFFLNLPWEPLPAGVKWVHPHSVHLSCFWFPFCLSLLQSGFPPNSAAEKKHVQHQFFKRRRPQWWTQTANSSVRQRGNTALHLYRGSDQLLFTSPAAPSCMCEDKMWNMAPSCDQTLTLDHKLWRNHDSDAVQIVLPPTTVRQLPLSFLGSVSQSFPSTSALCTLTSP